MSRKQLMPLAVLVMACAGHASYVLAQQGGSAAAAIAAAVADPARPETDRARDADRKPAEVIAFAGIKPGSRITEFGPGGGYFTRIFSGVVGSAGVVNALAQTRPPNAPPPTGPTPSETLAATPGYTNVRVITIDALVASNDLSDFVWTSLNYHDLHNRPNADLVAFNKQVLSLLKPGGIYIVIDHAAQSGSGKRDTGTLHRIDPELGKSEAVSAGFEFVGESDVLRNPADAKDKGVREVPRGKTDQFVYKFRKPAR
jgi:predicted methyltransferase